MLAFRQGKIVLFIAYLVVQFLGSFWVWNHSQISLFDTHKEQLDRFAEFISSKLDKYAHIPQLVAKDTELIDALFSPSNTAQIEITNRYLEQVNSTIQSTDVYLLDKWGNTIAASNWNLERSFIGRNYAWRPYFSQAISGVAGQYFALGSSSKQRGYYFSYPVTYAAEILGVIVVKMDLSAIEQSWQNRTNIFVATDPKHVVFMSSHENWLFKSLTTLSENERQTILNSRQYLDIPIRSLGLSGDLSNPTSELTNASLQGLEHDYLLSSRPLADHPLTIRVLTSKITLVWKTLSYALITTLLFVIVYLSMLLNYQRLLKKRQFEQLQSEAKQKLEFLVMERTAELHVEINERAKTEQVLRQTQDELIQAAKLAVLGQMSASISHELNNPLAAIRSFADNGRRFLDKQKWQRVDENLVRISALTDRMAKISGQLRSFARKSDSSETSCIDIGPTLHSAVELVNPQLKAAMVHFSLNLEPPLPAVEINAIQLEQVLINLLTNALQAFDDQQDKQIQVSSHVDDDHLLIYVDDNGPGIKEAQHSHLFEPFYTTKKNGLGLGLSISQQIIQAMGGVLSLESAPLGGARFTIALPIPNKHVN